MPAESKPNLFISYARADDESFVERLHNDLETRGIRVWWDRQSMSNRGLTFLDEIQRAIESVDRVIAVVGPNALKSKYVLYEWDYALLFGKAVVPILCLGDYASIPGNLTRDIRNYHCPDFRVERPYNQALDELERIVREPVAPFGPVRATPALPPGFLPRRDAMNAMWEVLYADIERPKLVASAAEQTLVLHGMGGSGKSVLAAAFARSIDTRRAANDGIVWLKAGRDTKPGDRLANLWLLGLTFNDDPKYYVDEKPARGRLSQLLADKGCVIVLDDVWSKDDAEPYLNALGPRCRLLVTTRDAGLAVLGRSEALDVLNDDQALELLARSSRHAVDALPTASKEVAKECGNLPLALAMIGAMVNGNPDRWEHALHRLRTLKLDKIQFSIPNYDYTNLLLAIQVSIDDLKQDQQARYLELAVFPRGISIPENTLRVLWEPAGVDRYDATDLIDLFVRRSLARTFAKGTILLHDLQSDYIRARTADQVALNGRLLDSYAKRCSDGWPSGPKDGYYFEHLPWHLKEAGRTTELRQLLFNFDWLLAKLEASDVNALIADYDYIAGDEELRLIQDTLRLSAHVLARDARQLTGQLIGRLLGNKTASIQVLLKQAAGRKICPWLRPLRPNLTPPGRPLIRTLEGHTEEVRAVAVTADGRRAVSASRDQTLRVWDLESGQSVRTLEGHSNLVNGVAITPDGRRAVSASRDRTLRVWDLESGETLQTLQGHTGSVYAVAVTSDGRRAVSGSKDQTLRMWDLESGQALRTLEGHTEEVRAVAVTPDGRRVVSASEDKTLRVWDLESGQLLRTLEGHTGWVRAVAVTPDGRRAVSASNDQTLRVWDLGTGQPLRTLEGHTNIVYAVAVTPDGRRVVSASEDKTLRLWDLETGKTLRTLEGHTEEVRAVAVTPDGRRAVSASEDQTLRVWDLGTGKTLRTLEGHTGWVRAVAVMPDGHRVVSASEDQTLRVWDLESGQTLYTLKGHTSWVSAVAVMPDGHRAVSASNDRTLRVWDLGTGKTLHKLEGHTEIISAVALTSDGRRAVSASNDRTLRVWDLGTGKTLHKLEGHTEIISAVALTSDGRRAVSASNDQTLRTWDLESGQTLRTLKGHTSWVSAVAVTPDGRWVVLTSNDRTVRLCDLESGEEKDTFTGESGRMHSCAIAPDGRTIIAGDALGRVHFLRLVEADQTNDLLGQTKISFLHHEQPLTEPDLQTREPQAYT
jgi:WD40 repeat protein